MCDHEIRGIVSKTEKGKILLRLSKHFYEKSAVMAAAYKFTDRCFILIEPLEEGYVGVYFEAKVGQDEMALINAGKDFCNEVLDQQVRLDLEARYGSLRDTIVRHAFSPIKDLKKQS